MRLSLVCVLFDLAIPTSFFSFIQLFLYLYYSILISKVNRASVVSSTYQQATCSGVRLLLVVQVGLHFRSSMRYLARSRYPFLKLRISSRTVIYKPCTSPHIVMIHVKCMLSVHAPVCTYPHGPHYPPLPGPCSSVLQSKSVIRSKTKSNWHSEHHLSLVSP